MHWRERLRPRSLERKQKHLKTTALVKFVSFFFPDCYPLGSSYHKAHAVGALAGSSLCFRAASGESSSCTTFNAHLLHVMTLTHRKTFAMQPICSRNQFPLRHILGSDRYYLSRHYIMTNKLCRGEYMWTNCAVPTAIDSGTKVGRTQLSV
jgi:hypothetical protein